MTRNNGDNRTREELLDEIERLRFRLDEAEQTLDAIRSGEVDALIVAGPHGDQIFSLTGSERIYRQVIETMNEGALTVGIDGTILFCNQRFCSLVQYPMAEVIGRNYTVFSDPAQLPRLKVFLADAQAGPVQQSFLLRAADGATVPVNIAASMLMTETDSSICLVVSDLTVLEAKAGAIGDLLKQQHAMEVQQADLNAVNQELRESQRAALNLVEDVEIARRKTEEAHKELGLQMEERVRELREKEVLLKEVHHRVKNNLQVISSLVSMQADGSKDNTVRDVLQDVIYRVRSMALVHEKLYHSESLSRVDFAEYSRSLLGYLWRAHGAVAEFVRLTLDLEPIELQVDIATPCGLILNELAGNALKHAFRGRSEGEVMVSLQKAETGMVFLSVRDNGVGLPEEFDWRKSGSLGLRLVQMLAGQLQAAVEVERDGGTKFTVSFRLKAEG
jgi:PAS domain S-box-containing protein